MQIPIVPPYSSTITAICTIEDILEELVGNISDEFDEDDDELVRLSNGDYIVAGDMTLSDLEDAVEVELTDDEYDTIAGLVLSLLDRVPEEREHPVVHYKNLDIKVLKVAENAIAKVMIHANPETEEGAEEPDKDGKGE